MQLNLIPNVLILGPQNVPFNPTTYAKFEQAVKDILTKRGYVGFNTHIHCGDGTGIDELAGLFGDTFKVRKIGKTINFPNAMYDKNFNPVSTYQLTRRYKKLIGSLENKPKIDLVIFFFGDEGAFSIELVENQFSLYKQIKEHCNNLNIHMEGATTFILNEGMKLMTGDIDDVDSNIITVEYDLCEDGVGFFTSEVMLDVLALYPTLPDQIISANADSVKPRLIHSKNSDDGDVTSFLTIPTAINHKFISKAQYVTNIRYIKKVVDNNGLEIVYLPRLGNCLLNGEWERRGGELCDHAFDRRFIIVYPDIEYADEFREFSNRDLNIHESDELYDSYKTAMSIDCAKGYGHILDELSSYQGELTNLYSTEGKVGEELEELVKTDLQRIIEFLFSKQNARRYYLHDLNQVSGMEDKFTYAEHLIRNWAEDPEQEHFRKLDKSRLCLGNFNIRNMLIGILISIQGYKVKYGAPILSAIASMSLSLTPFGDRFEKIDGDTEFMSKKRGTELAADVLSMMEKAGLVRFTKEAKSKTNEGGERFFANVWVVDTNDVVSDITLAMVDLSMTLPPMVCKPLEVKKNHDSPYQTINRHVISNPYHRHDDELCLDIINLYNNTSYCLDIDMVEHGRNEFKRPDNWHKLNKEQQERCRENWQKQVDIGQFVYGLMYMLGNKFNLSWFYDYRGRIYSHGNHITLQGDDYRKSIIRFSNGVKPFTNITDEKLEETVNFLLDLEDLDFDITMDEDLEVYLNSIENEDEDEHQIQIQNLIQILTQIQIQKSTD